MNSAYIYKILRSRNRVESSKKQAPVQGRRLFYAVLFSRFEIDLAFNTLLANILVNISKYSGNSGTGGIFTRIPEKCALRPAGDGRRQAGALPPPPAQRVSRIASGKKRALTPEPVPAARSAGFRHRVR
jgi:hypothetical protein